MARTNKLDVLLKRTRKVGLGIYHTQIQSLTQYHRIYPLGR